MRSLILSWLTEKESTQENVGMAVARRILLLIEHDDTFVDELSTGERLPVRTVTYLWQFLTGHLENEVSPDLFIDLYHQFDLLEHPVEILPDRALVKRQMSRWPTGLDPEVIAIRERNKERIIACLIKKIERRHSPSVTFPVLPRASPMRRKRLGYVNGGIPLVSICRWRSRVLRN